MEVIFSLDFLCLQEDNVAIQINKIVIALALTPSITWAFVLTCYLWIPPLSITKDSANSMALSAALTKKLISTMRWLAFINVLSYLHCIAEFPTPQNIKPSKKPNVKDSITFDLPKQIQQSRKRMISKIIITTMTLNYQPSPPTPTYVCSCSGCMAISPLSDHFDSGVGSPNCSRPDFNSTKTCPVCPLTVRGGKCYECREIVTTESYAFPSPPSSPGPRTLVGKNWFDITRNRKAPPSRTTPTRWCAGCAATTIGEACFVCASVVTADTFTFHPKPFSQGSTVIVGPVWYHVTRKRMNKLRRQLHEAKNYEDFLLDAPLPPVNMNFAKTRFEGPESQGIAQEGEHDSLIGRAKQLLAANLITKNDDRMLSTICNLIVEMWFHGGAVFESDIISLSFPERLEEEDRHNWSALGLDSENDEESILGLTKKLAAMRYLTKQDEMVIEDFCVDIAMRWADFAGEAPSDYKIGSETTGPTKEYDSDYESALETESEDKAMTDKCTAFTQQPRIIHPEPFAWQFGETDALLDARTKLAYIHILAADDQPKSIYHIDPKLAKQIDFLTKMPSPQETSIRDEAPKRSVRTLTEVEWEILRPTFDQERDFDLHNSDSEQDDAYETSFNQEEDEESESESESESLDVYIADATPDLPSLEELSPMFPNFIILSPTSPTSPIYRLKSPTLSAPPVCCNFATSPDLYASSPCQTMSGTLSLRLPVYRTRTSTISSFPEQKETLLERLERELLEGESATAQKSEKGIDCRLINDWGEAFEWSILL